MRIYIFIVFKLPAADLLLLHLIPLIEIDVPDLPSDYILSFGRVLSVDISNENSDVSNARII